MSTATTFVVETDDDFDAVMQSPTRTGVAARYQAGDTLSAELWQPGGSSPLATGLTVGWLTVAADGVTSQTGYDQGQTVTTLPASLVSTLVPRVAYTLKVFRLMSGTGRRERIASATIRVVAPGRS